VGSVNAAFIDGGRRWPVLGLVLGLALGEPVARPAEAAKVESIPVKVLKVEGAPGAVEVMRSGATVWDPARDDQVLYPGDRLRTLEKGRVTLRWSDNTTVRLPPFSDVVVEPSRDTKVAGFSLLKGLLYFFHRDQPTEARFKTRTAAAAIRGTEFVIEFIEPEGRTIVSVLDGEVELSNPENQTTRLVSGEQGVVEPGRPPRKTAGIVAANVVQWCLYYPGVLDVDELELSTAAAAALESSLAAYRRGDLLGALANYPVGRVPTSVEEQVYQAAVLLAVGQVEPAERLLSDVRAARPEVRTQSEALADALRKMIAAVKFQTYPATSSLPMNLQDAQGPFTPALSPLDGERVSEGRVRGFGGSTSEVPFRGNLTLASEWLAESYYEQSRSKLPEALAAARRAAEKSPKFGLAWARVAELELCFARTRAARAALDKALELAPDNAQAAALKGFLLAAQDQVPTALGWFDRAITLDGGLGNGWLGRGLCKIRRGRINDGKDDLQVAATVEPQRALLRSYLAKGWSAARDNARARQELKLAIEKDPSDPTAWFYSALLDQQENQVNDAVRDLEKSKELNDRRSVYRSRLLLDQDRAVRGANLASIYREAGMSEVGTWEAARAVNADPANYSAHLFLGNSYYEMLDLPLYNQRYEAARVNEYLTATLLAPVGAGLASQPVSAQEYSRLLERDGLGLYSSTEYLSRGAWQQYGAQYGRLGGTSYSIDGYCRTDPGQRANNDLEQRYGSFQLKQEITPADTVYLEVVLTEATFGDLSPVYDPDADGNPLVRQVERQQPLLLLGYHREWSPGQHTLLLAGRFEDTLEMRNPLQQTLALSHLDPDTFEFQPAITGVLPLSTPQEYQSALEIYSVEAQQIFQREAYALIGGVRYQTGSFDTQSDLTIPNGSPLNPDWFVNPPQGFESDLERFSVYAYAHWQVLDPLRLIVGVSYDWLKYPADFRFAPLAADEATTDQWSPKAGFIWTPFARTTLRGAYSRSLGGASLDQSFQLEPSQVAGFNQAWRSIIPEAVAGANAAAEFETGNLLLEHAFPTRTYLGVGGEILKSRVDRLVGAFETTEPQTGVFPLPPFIVQSGLEERLEYEERSVAFSVNQLLGESWGLGARYRLSEAQFESEFPVVPPAATLGGGVQRERDESALLHQVLLDVRYTHRCGFFSHVNAVWFLQDNQGYATPLPGDEFWQFNAFVGYRFPRRQAEVRVGVLNLTGQDYRLNPLNLVSGLPRERTFTASFRFSF